jgi:hypothetical protein
VHEQGTPQNSVVSSSWGKMMTYRSYAMEIVVDRRFHLVASCIEFVELCPAGMSHRVARMLLAGFLSDKFLGLLSKLRMKIQHTP